MNTPDNLNMEMPADQKFKKGNYEIERRCRYVLFYDDGELFYWTELDQIGLAVDRFKKHKTFLKETGKPFGV